MAYAGGISKLGWFKGNADKWENTKLIVFCVGESSIDNPEIEPALKPTLKNQHLKKRTLKNQHFKKVSIFYCPDGFNYEKMSALTKLIRGGLSAQNTIQLYQ